MTHYRDSAGLNKTTPTKDSIYIIPSLLKFAPTKQSATMARPVNI
jgi:hypothetical protein